MAFNGISTLPTKQDRQIAKLNLAQARRQAGGDISAPYYRSYNVYDIARLPTRYVGNEVIDNAGELLPSRPWYEGTPSESNYLIMQTGSYVLNSSGGKIYLS